jgi:hypothetical protein
VRQQWLVPSAELTFVTGWLLWNALLSFVRGRSAAVDGHELPLASDLYRDA